MGNFFEKFRARFIGDIQGAGGCETCGYGAEEGMSEEEYLKLLNEMDEMDEWIEAEKKSANADVSGLPRKGD